MAISGSARYDNTVKPPMDGNEKYKQSVNIKEFVQAGGVDLMRVNYQGAESPSRQVAHQADVIYISGHGSHSQGTLTYRPDESAKASDVKDTWTKVSTVIISGCSVLDINDYRGNFQGDEHGASPGKQWAQMGDKLFLGYNGSAPSDSGGASRLIVDDYFTNVNNGSDPVSAWKDANAKNHAWNACVIDTRNQAKTYYYFEGKYLHEWTSVSESKW
jgi:hypothetical protein